MALLMLIVSPAFAVPMLNLGQVAVNGTTVSFPVTLANAQNSAIAGITTDIIFDSGTFALVSDAGGAIISATKAAAAAGKELSQVSPKDNVLRIVIIDTGGNSLISNGNVATVTFSVKPGAAPSNKVFKINNLSASDNSNPANTVAMAGTNTYVTSLADALLVLKASAGIAALTPEQLVWADMNGDGTVNAGDALMILARVVGL